MQRNRHRKLTIDVMLQQAELQRQLRLKNGQINSQKQTDGFLNSFQETHKQEKYQKVYSPNQNHLYQSFLQKMDFFEIKIKGINSRTDKKNQNQNFSSIKNGDQNDISKKQEIQKNIKLQDKTDHTGTLQITELMWTQNLNRDEISRIFSRQKCTLQTIDKDSSTKQVSLYQQLRHQNNFRQKPQKSRFSNNPNEKLNDKNENNNFPLNKQCCQIM